MDMMRYAPVDSSPPPPPAPAAPPASPPPIRQVYFKNDILLCHDLCNRTESSACEIYFSSSYSNVAHTGPTSFHDPGFLA